MIWIILALLAAFFTSMTTILAKIGIKNVNSNFATFIRTGVVILCSLLLCIINKDLTKANQLTVNNYLFLILSGVATGFAWLCEYEALNYVGANPIAVNSIGKLSILLTMFLSFAILKEKFTKKSCLGLALLTAGIILIIIFSL